MYLYAMNLESQYTSDGSVTLLNKELRATYHSVHGAIQESRHIYITHGLQQAVRVFGSSLRVIEIGLGTGLNALLSRIEAEQQSLNLDYIALEKYPVSADLLPLLNYPEQLGVPRSFLDTLHHCPWQRKQEICPGFHFTRYQEDVSSFLFPESIHCVFFDAFAPETSPEMWQPVIFEQLYKNMLPGSCLVSFCAKGEIKRTWKRIGFYVESLPGPPGKREMTRAIKK
jgi:tRNA U34 5-methylaminomethyl-2-thiouridine-forming methyltransferase MnmC